MVLARLARPPVASVGGRGGCAPSAPLLSPAMQGVTMSEHPFDSLARALAAGASRRGVLRALGGAVVGTLVAAPPRVVLADNSACAQFCAATFGANTSAAGQCTSDAAHGNPKSLCSTCGPASS